MGKSISATAHESALINPAQIHTRCFHKLSEALCTHQVKGGPVMTAHDSLDPINKKSQS
jgi:hypothetical protein